MSELQPDLVLLDVSLPNIGGVSLAEHLRKHCAAVKVLALSAHEDQACVRAMLAAGAAGSVSKRSPPEELLRAIRSVAVGLGYVDPVVAMTLVDLIATRGGGDPNKAIELSAREAQVLRLIARGHAIKDIAARLAVGVRTVETYRTRGVEKAGLTSRADLIHFALKRVGSCSPVSPNPKRTVRSSIAAGLAPERWHLVCRTFGMSRFLFASTAVRAHSSNPLPIAARLIERGHRVDWYAGQAFHASIASVGARPFAFEDAIDFSTTQLWESFPALANKRGPRLISQAYADIFVGQARARVSDLRRILREHPADAMLCDSLMFGVELVHELGGPAWATFGDTPLTIADRDTPPFGAGLLPMAGPLGRLRNRVVAAAVSRFVYARPNSVYREARAEVGLPPTSEGALPCLTSPYLHLQACTSSFEYPRVNLPPHVHWIGGLHPDGSPEVQDVAWWSELGRARRVVHVTQGSLRHDLQELIVPSLRALAHLDALVVVTTGGCDARAVEAAYGGALPANARVAPFVPYDRLLEHADLLVTNGGYTGVMIALRHGVPIVQAGVTEEKAEIGARIAWSGVGVRLATSRPSVAALRGAVQRVSTDSSFARAAEHMQRELREHDASAEAADRLEQLASTGRAVLRPRVDGAQQPAFCV